MMTSFAASVRSIARIFIGAAVAFVGFSVSAHPGDAADEIRIGVVHSQGGASAFVAAAKGFFKDEGIDAKLVFFPSAAPIAVAAASGDIEFGSTALTAAFCNLANEGTLRIIAAGGWERPGFQTIGFMVSNQAYAAKLHAFKDMRGHSAGITQRGTPLEYALARILKKYDIPLEAVRIVALQSNPNVASALKGGEVDVGVQTVANIYTLVQKGDAKLLGWIADELGGGQSTVTFTTGKIAKERPDLVSRFLAAFRKGGAVWDSAFLDAQGNRRDQPNAPEMIDIAAKALNQSPEVVARGIGYFDPENRIVLSDMQGLLNWYKDYNMIKTRMDANALLDKRFVIFAEPSSSGQRQ
jgi:NitT/TauT family transport system substrate-binding protein